MKRLRDYLLLTEQEYAMLEALDVIPEEMLPFFHKMLFGTREESDQAEKEIMAIAKARGLIPKDKQNKEDE